MGFTMSQPPHSNDERSSEPLTKKLPSMLQMAAAARRGGGVGGQHGGQHIQWEAHTVGGRHVLGRWQVGEWRGWAGGHATGLGLHPAARAGTAWHTTWQEEDGECQWGRSAHGVAWRDGAGDVRWVAGGQTERAGAQSVWVGERAGRHVP